MRSSDLAPCLLGLGLLGLALPGCFEPIEHEGRRCPCAAGYVCDMAADRCVREGTDASAGIDAAGPVSDTGPRDAPALDALVTGEDAHVVVLDAPSADPDAATIDAAVPGTDAWVASADAWAADARAMDAWAPDARMLDAWAADAWAADARTVDARTDAWAPDAPGFSYCPPGTRLCDDFESLEDNRVPPWSYSDGEDCRSTERASRGVASGRFSGMPPSGEQSIGLDVSSSPSEVWGRFWLLVRPRTGTADVRDVAIFHLGDDTAPRFDNISVTLNDTGLGTYNTAAGMYRAGPAIADDTWTCVALHVVVGDPGTVELYVGSTLAFSGSERTTFAGGAIRVVDAGLTYLDPASNRVTLHLDDIAVGLGPSPLRCP